MHVPLMKVSMAWSYKSTNAAPAESCMTGAWHCELATETEIAENDSDTCFCIHTTRNAHATQHNV